MGTRLRYRSAAERCSGCIARQSAAAELRTISRESANNRAFDFVTPRGQRIARRLQCVYWRTTVAALRQERAASGASGKMSHSGISRAVLVPNLLRRRLQSALTQGELARAAGVSRATVTRAEAGEEIRISSVRKLARALRCQPRDLLGPL